MTATEFKENFNILYNNALAGAPGLDNFEISTYLTLAQEEIVKNSYVESENPDGNFESREYNRRMINELVVDEKVSMTVTSARGLVPDSKFFELDNSVMFIVLETATINSADGLLNGKMIDVKPTTHDEFLKSYRNPFRRPNKNKAWRLDISKQNSKTTVEIICPFKLSRYNARYIKFPSPIIVSDLTLDEEVGGLGLTIEGKTAPATSVLNKLVHNDIVEKAVMLAVRDYRDGSIQSKAQLRNDL